MDSQVTSIMNTLLLICVLVLSPLVHATGTQSLATSYAQLHQRIPVLKDRVAYANFYALLDAEVLRALNAGQSTSEVGELTEDISRVCRSQEGARRSDGRCCVLLQHRSGHASVPDPAATRR